MYLYLWVDVLSAKMHSGCRRVRRKRIHGGGSALGGSGAVGPTEVGHTSFSPPKQTNGKTRVFPPKKWMELEEFLAQKLGISSVYVVGSFGVAKVIGLRWLAPVLWYMEVNPYMKFPICRWYVGVPMI